MQAETILPSSRNEWLNLKTKDITSTEISALFGVSPYCTEFELWHRKKDGSIVEIEDNDFMKWGRRLQDSIATGIAEDNGWNIRKMDEYMRIPALRLGSSFDFSIEGYKKLVGGKYDDGIIAPLTDRTYEIMKDKGVIKEPLGILEIKNVFGLKFKDEWLEDESGNFEAPPHIELQAQHQLMVSGRDFCYIAALVGGNKVVLIKRLPDQNVISAIKSKVCKFWESIDGNNPPQPNFEKDSEFISKLYGFAEPNKLFDARNDAKIETLAAEHKELVEKIKTAEARKDAIKAEILTMIGDAEKVAANGFSISAGVVGPAKIEYERAGYRTFRINWPRSRK